MKYKYIDALRGLAILCVMMVHTAQHGSNSYPSIISSIIDQGGNGVQLFYLASALTLFLSFHYRSKNELRPTWNFFIRRFFRIAPLYYMGIGYFILQNGLGPRYWLGDAESITTANILSNVFFVHGFNPYWITSLVPGGWSIAVEMTFYAILPILVIRITSLNKAISFTIGAFIFSLVLKFFFRKFPLIEFERLWGEYLILYFPNQLAVFGLGIISYFIIFNKDYKISAMNSLIITALLMANLIYPIFPAHFLFGLTSLVLIITLSKKEYRILVNKPLIFLGKISYGAYLVHFAVLHWLSHFEFVDFIPIENNVSSVANFLIRFVVVIIITSVFSWILHYTVELPFQKIGKQIIRKLESKRPVTESVNG